MANTSTMSASFEISIPEEIRAEQDWKEGQEFAFVPKGVGYLLVPVPTPDDLFGSAKGADTSGYRDRSDRY